MALIVIQAFLLAPLSLAIGGCRISINIVERCARQEFLIALCCFLPLCVLGGFILAVRWTAVEALHAPHLPDPELDINAHLTSNNITPILHRCIVPAWGSRPPLFEFYMGMPKGFCPQLLAAKAIYGDYLDNLPEYIKDGGRGPLEVLLLLPGRWILSSATLFVYALFFCESLCLLISGLAGFLRAVSRAKSKSSEDDVCMVCKQKVVDEVD